MRRTAGPLLLLPLLCQAAPARASSEKPNIVFILVDDMDAALPAFMPKTKALVAEAGVSFDSYLVNVSLCCPSRATTLRGQYARNTTVLTNSPPNGGYSQFLSAHDDSSTAATWLQASGYRTAFYGKYLNGYPGSEKTYVPPGWNEWASPSGGSPYSEYDYQLNDNGRLVAHGHKASDYLTDVIAAKAESFVRKAGSDHVPFFLFLTPYAPHSPATPPPRHETLFAGARAAPGTPGQGGPVITETLAAGSEFRIPDVIAWLRTRGYCLTEGTSAIGSLAIWAPTLSIPPSSSLARGPRPPIPAPRGARSGSSCRRSRVRPAPRSRSTAFARTVPSARTSASRRCPTAPDLRRSRSRPGMATPEWPPVPRSRGFPLAASGGSGHLSWPQPV